MSQRYTQDEDLPRTLIREKAARQAAANQSAPMASGNRNTRFDPVEQSHAQYQAMDDVDPSALPGVAVERFNVPFFRLAWFLMKCVLAGVPALLLLFAMLWGFGQAVQKVMPWLIKMKILISFQ